MPFWDRPDQVRIRNSGGLRQIANLFRQVLRTGYSGLSIAAKSFFNILKNAYKIGAMPLIIATLLAEKLTADVTGINAYEEWLKGGWMDTDTFDKTVIKGGPKQLLDRIVYYLGEGDFGLRQLEYNYKLSSDDTKKLIEEILIGLQETEATRDLTYNLKLGLGNRLNAPEIPINTVEGVIFTPGDPSGNIKIGTMEDLKQEGLINGPPESGELPKINPKQEEIWKGPGYRPRPPPRINVPEGPRGDNTYKEEIENVEEDEDQGGQVSGDRSKIPPGLQPKPPSTISMGGDVFVPHYFFTVKNIDSKGRIIKSRRSNFKKRNFKYNKNFY